MWSIPLGLISLAALSSGMTSPFLMPLTSASDLRTCPQPMENFDLSQFLGNWYILEYEYAEETRLNSVDCLGFKFTVDDVPSLQLDMSVMTANFTFRFPPKSGHSYNVPTYAFFADDTSAKWTTTFKNTDMVSVVVDTDYSRWAVLAQCVKNDYGPPSFLSTRIMGRSRALNSADMERARAAIRDSQVDGGYIYGVGQDDC